MNRRLFYVASMLLMLSACSQAPEVAVSPAPNIALPSDSAGASASDSAGASPSAPDEAPEIDPADAGTPTPTSFPLPPSVTVPPAPTDEPPPSGEPAATDVPPGSEESPIPQEASYEAALQTVNGFLASLQRDPSGASSQQYLTPDFQNTLQSGGATLAQSFGVGAVAVSDFNATYVEEASDNTVRVTATVSNNDTEEPVVFVLERANQVWFISGIEPNS